MDAARSRFDSLAKWSDLQALVDEAVPEDNYLECKTQTGVTLSQNTKRQLAETISAMSNASGGTILLGVATTAVSSHKLDVISGLEPIGNVDKLAARVRIDLPMTIVPPVSKLEVRTIKKGRTDSGVVAIFVPQVTGDPVRSNMDDIFYFRGSDGDSKAPYEVIRRLFAASSVPDLVVRIHEGIAQRSEDGSFMLPILVENLSSAIARDVVVLVSIDNHSDFVKIKVDDFSDHSEVNPGQRLFITRPVEPIHRALDVVVGRLEVRMAGDKWPKRVLNITVTLYADRMRARAYKIKANLKSGGLEMKPIGEAQYLY